jgi:hypothetical protein
MTPAPANPDWLPSLRDIAAETGQLQEPELPCRSNCGTDEFLILEEFLPLPILPDACQQPAAVDSSAGRCKQFGGQDNPSS